jgi:hypothetical protein
MSFFQEDGVFTSRTSVGTDVVTLTGAGSSLDVKLVRLVINSATTTGAANGDARLSIGFSDGTNHASMGYASQDALATSDAYRTQNTTAVLTLLNTAGTITDQATISSIGNGTFTVNWTTKSATAYEIGYTAWGGSDIDAEVGSFTGVNSTGNQSVTTTLKNANACFFFGGVQTTTGNISNTGACFVGFATAVGEEGCLHISSRDAVGTANTQSYQRDDRCINTTFTASASLLEEGVFNGFDADGFDINWVTVSGSLQYIYMYALIKGGQWEAGSSVSPTTATTSATTTSFEPSGVTVITNSHAAGTGVDTDAYFCIGSSDGTNQYAFAVGDQDGVGTTQTGIHHATDEVLLINDVISATNGLETVEEAAFSSFNETDFTLSFNPAEATQNQYLWIVCAGTPSGGSGGLAGILDNDLL